MTTVPAETLEELLASVADERPTPGAGSVAAFAVALAAALVEMVLRSAEDWDEAPGAVAQAVCLRERAAPLAPAATEAYGAVLDAFDAEAGDAELGRKLELAADVPLRLAEAAADVAELAVVAAEQGDQRRRPDAVAAALLAEGAARAAAHLVAVNLAALPGDERSARATAAAAAAAAAAARAAGERA